MRIVLFGNRKPRTRTPWYFLRAFQSLGHTVKWIRYRKLRSYMGKRLTNMVLRLWLSRLRPDLLFVHSKDISLELLAWAKDRMPIVLYYDDPRDKPEDKMFRQILEYGRLVHILFTTSRQDVADYEAEGVKAHYVTGGCDPEFHKPHPNPGPFYESELAFIGRPAPHAGHVSNYGQKGEALPERVAWLKKLGEKFDLKLYGPGWDKYGLTPHKEHAYAEDYQKICSGAKIILGHNKEKLDLYFSNRVWYTLGCRGFFLTTYTPNMEEIFERGVHLDWFHTEEECEEKIRYYLEHDEERQKIAQQGFELAHGQYSYRHLAERILNVAQQEGLFSR